MSTPPIGDAIRGILAGTRYHRATMSQRERLAAAAALVGVAVVLAWPTRSPVPQLLQRVPIRFPKQIR